MLLAETAASSAGSQDEEAEEEAEEDAVGDVLLFADSVAEYMDIAEIEESLSEMTATKEFSFWGTVKAFLTGELPFSAETLTETAAELFLGELKEQKQLAVQILLVAFLSAVFSNFVRVFESHQISDISFFMMYLMLSALLMNSFSALTEMVSDTCSSLNTFMKILLPSYVITIVASAGTVTALEFYEITLLAVGLLQSVILKVVLPAVHIYMLVLLLSQLSDGDVFSRSAALLETLISWGVRSLVGIVVGLQAVQCLTAPAYDALKNSSISRVASVIPGVGSVLNAATETVLGSAVVLKNAVGAAGILALGMICLTPLIKLLVCILLFRFLCAIIAPICEKRMVDGIETISKGSVLLLRVMGASLAVFVISLAMIMASIRSG
ncbi:MAG: stage III sporulation protein AE [Lachnospiraceae bacterium]|nr:stage III sporulation protein AE [Lachnospiraceae bacterium]